MHFENRLINHLNTLQVAIMLHEKTNEQTHYLCVLYVLRLSTLCRRCNVQSLVRLFLTAIGCGQFMLTCFNATHPQNHLIKIMSKKLTIFVSQDCETKSGRFIVSPRELSVEFVDADAVGIVIGDLVDQFFDVLDVQRRHKRCPYKLNKPINLKVCYEDTALDNVGSSLRDTFEQGVKISGKLAVKNFACFLVDLLTAVAKQKRPKASRPHVADIMSPDYVRTDTMRALCDSNMKQFLSVAQ